MKYQLMLKPIRRARNLTQSQAAELIGVSERKLASWERGETKITLEDAFKCAMVLECDVNELCGWYTNNPRPVEIMNLEHEEQELLRCYRSSTSQWQQNIAMTARAAAGESKEAAKRGVSSTEERAAI